jgi:hypothetical protein
LYSSAWLFLIARWLRATQMKTERFGAPRDAMMTYAALVKCSRTESKIDVALMQDLDARIAALQQQLKDLQRNGKQADRADEPREPADVDA